MTARRLSKIAHSEPAAATAGQILFSTQHGRILNNYAAPVKAESPPHRLLHLLSIVSSFEQPRHKE
jgi:hypothetical protein